LIFFENCHSLVACLKGQANSARLRNPRPHKDDVSSRVIQTASRSPALTSVHRINPHRNHPQSPPPVPTPTDKTIPQKDNPTMLRRKPTAITLTAEDISSYEDRQAREALLQAQAAAQAEAQARAQAQMQAQGRGGGLVTPQKGQNQDPSVRGAMAPPPVVEKPRKTREERLGIAGRSGV
jgi:hypothetical protein